MQTHCLPAGELYTSEVDIFVSLLAGTSVNPMLRAAYLAKDSHRKVILVVPWLPPEEQPKVFPKGVTFATKEEHAKYILEGKLAIKQQHIHTPHMLTTGTRDSGTSVLPV